MNFESHDIIYIESQIEIADYVRESAKYEVDSGNDTYIGVYEAATEVSEKMNDSWISKIISKIKAFVKTAMGKLRMVLNQLANKIRSHKIKKMQIRLESERYQNLILADDKIENGIVDVTRLHSANAASIFYRLKEFNRFDKNSMNGVLIEYVDVIEKWIKSDKAPNNITEFYHDELGMKYSDEKRSYSIQRDLTLNIKDIKEFLNKSAFYLNKLAENTKHFKSDISQLIDKGLEKSSIKRNFILLYNYTTHAIKEHYQLSMALAKYFMSAGEKMDDEFQEYQTSNDVKAPSNEYISLVKRTGRNLLMDERDEIYSFIERNKDNTSGEIRQKIKILKIRIDDIDTLFEYHNKYMDDKDFSHIINNGSTKAARLALAKTKKRGLMYESLGQSYERTADFSRIIDTLTKDGMEEYIHESSNQVAIWEQIDKINKS